MISFRKKLISMLLCMALTASMLTACSKSEPVETAPTSNVTEAAATSAPESTPTNVPKATPTAEITPAEENASTDVTAAPVDETDDQTEENTDGQQDEGQGGQSWAATIYTGNLPEEIPDRNDDMYTYYNYDFLQEHQGDNIVEVAAHSGDLISGVFSILADESQTSHEIEQLRLFISQAYDTETLKEQGISEVLPYIERIQNVSSLEEMNKLLTSEDFPFSPFINSSVGFIGRNEKNAVSLFPNLLFVDGVAVGGKYYADADSEDGQRMIAALSGMGYLGLMADLPYIGVEAEDIRNWYDQLIAFEISYGKYADYTEKYLMMEYGEFAEEGKRSIKTIDELEELSPAFPIREILAKTWNVSDVKYSILSCEWLQVFNELWTEENLETIKMMAIAKVLDETRPFRDNTAFNAIAEQYGLAVDPMTFAYNACNKNTTFAHLIVELYISECLGAEAVEKISGITLDLVEAYKELIKETEWLEDDTKENLIDKLDKLNICILAPNSGYYDFGDLELIPYEDGGTLLGNYLILKKHQEQQNLEIVNSSTWADYEWYLMEPTLVNAFYDPVANAIDILPGYVSSIIYNEDMDYTDLLGTIGVTIGHEISHGFDFVGSQFNGDAEPVPIYTDDDLNDFLEVCSRIADYFGSIEIEPGVYLSGELVKGEATADLSGMQAVLFIAENSDEIDLERFIDQYAYIWAKVVPEENIIVDITDSHPVAYLRVNAVLQMFDYIYDAFGISEDDGMYLAPEDRITLW